MADTLLTAQLGVGVPEFVLRSHQGSSTSAEDVSEVTARGETEGEASSRAIIRDSDIWFDDGNLVVRAGSGDGALHAFRCHSSVLAARSPVFRAMFQLPYITGEPTNGGQCVDLPDAWENVQALLKLLYGFSDMLPTRKRDPATLKIIAGPLRLAAKYEMDSVLQRLVPVLERDWPSRYEDWALIEAEVALRCHPRFEQNISCRDPAQDPAAVLQLAQLLGLRSVLPAAFYELSRASLDKADYVTHADVAMLSRADLVRFVIGRERLATHARRIRSRLSTLVWHEHFRILEGHGRCERGEGHVLSLHDAETCLVEMLHKLEERMRDFPQWLERDPLHEVDRFAELFGMNGPEVVKNSCFNCRDTLETMLYKQAKLLWNKLPEYFDLEPLQSCFMMTASDILVTSE